MKTQYLAPKELMLFENQEERAANSKAVADLVDARNLRVMREEMPGEASKGKLMAIPGKGLVDSSRLVPDSEQHSLKRVEQAVYGTQVEDVALATNNDWLDRLPRLSPPPAFEKFPSIPRLLKPIVISEKIDGTNAQVVVTELGEVLAGSRNRFLAPGRSTDNFGFAAWVRAHEAELKQLGVGRHYGEWWGEGIGRGYGMSERRFSLFNTSRWKAVNFLHQVQGFENVYVVPEITTLDKFDTTEILRRAMMLKVTGSLARRGWPEPEGIVVYHTAADALFKYTFDGDGHKGEKK
jgi:hypothetical protein